MLYFAYGSNMDREQMRRRCPKSRFLSRGKLRGWEFMINERGVATIVKSNRSTLGAVYEVTAVDLAYLDLYEGVRIGRYGRFQLPVEIHELDTVKVCVVYIDPSIETGTPRAGYLERVITGAKQTGLPKGYIRKLRTWKGTEENEITSSKEYGIRLWHTEEGRLQSSDITGD